MPDDQKTQAESLLEELDPVLLDLPDVLSAKAVDTGDGEEVRIAVGYKPWERQREKKKRKKEDTTKARLQGAVLYNEEEGAWFFYPEKAKMGSQLKAALDTLHTKAGIRWLAKVPDVMMVSNANELTLRWHMFGLKDGLPIYLNSIRYSMDTKYHCVIALPHAEAQYPAAMLAKKEELRVDWKRVEDGESGHSYKKRERMVPTFTETKCRPSPTKRRKLAAMKVYNLDKLKEFVPEFVDINSGNDEVASATTLDAMFRFFLIAEPVKLAADDDPEPIEVDDVHKVNLQALGM